MEITFSMLVPEKPDFLCVLKKITRFRLTWTIRRQDSELPGQNAKKNTNRPGALVLVIARAYRLTLSMIIARDYSHKHINPFFAYP